MPRPKRTITTPLMLEAARMYHLEDRSKVEIAKKLETNTRHVTELLESARKQGVIKFNIYRTAAQEIEERVREKYPHLKRAIICAGGENSTEAQYAGLIKQCAVGAADFFEKLREYLPRKVAFNVAVTGGRQILEFANAVPNRDRHEIYIQLAALIGRGHIQRTSHINPIVNASVLWARCGYLPGHSDYATVSPYPPRKPGLQARKDARIELEIAEQNQAIGKIVRAMDKIDVAFTGIGFVNPDDVPVHLRGHVGAFTLLQSVVTPEQIQAEGAAGSMGYCFFDKYGNGKEDWRFWLTPGHFSERNWGIEFYKRMVEAGKIVVTFANPFDIHAVTTALRAKMFNVLVTDEHSARKILAQD
jgi:DNA-binding transcriptional regulator LsrR (DeoR family)